METEGGWRRTGTQRKEEQQEEEPEEQTAEEPAEPEKEDEDKEEECLQGIASIALFPSGSLSGHFLHIASSTCLGLFGTGACRHDLSSFF